MNALRKLSDEDQLQAHRRDFLAWFDQHILPLLREQKSNTYLIALARHRHWIEYRKQHHLLTP